MSNFDSDVVPPIGSDFGGVDFAFYKKVSFGAGSHILNLKKPLILPRMTVFKGSQKIPITLENNANLNSISVKVISPTQLEITVPVTDVYTILVK